MKITSIPLLHTHTVTVSGNITADMVTFNKPDSLCSEDVNSSLTLELYQRVTIKPEHIEAIRQALPSEAFRPYVVESQAIGMDSDKGMLQLTFTLQDANADEWTDEAIKTVTQKAIADNADKLKAEALRELNDSFRARIDTINTQQKRMVTGFLRAPARMPYKLNKTLPEEAQANIKAAEARIEALEAELEAAHEAYNDAARQGLITLLEAQGEAGKAVIADAKLKI